MMKRNERLELIWNCIKPFVKTYKLYAKEVLKSQIEILLKEEKQRHKK
jgi:hypothetical protein